MPTIKIDRFGRVIFKSTPDKGVALSCAAVVPTFGILGAGGSNGFFVTPAFVGWGWGYNVFGELGINSTASALTPVNLAGAPKSWEKILGGFLHSMGIDKNGQAWGWGLNDVGQVGNNSTTNVSTPVSVLGTAKTFKVPANGYGHAGAIDTSGRVWCWGGNGNGQLGVNSTVSKRTPVSILGANKTFCHISMPADGYFTLAITNGGLIYGWGANAAGQLGTGTAVAYCTPVALAGATKTFCKIATAQTESAAIDKNGRVWCWGNNATGQLGNNSVTNVCTPVSILGGNKTFCDVARGIGFAIALDKSGQVWGWGYNAYGQLGDNSVVSKRTPVSIMGAKKTFCGIAASSYASYALDKNGDLWAWGNNYAGRVGDGTTVNKSTPVMIKNF